MTPDHVVAGHRVLRLLARGDRSQVWLAADDIVLKVLTPPWPADQPSLEAQALHRARGDHVVELLDVSAGGDAVVLVFPRLPRGSLAELLANRPGLEAGEAVTILAPLSAALARMHERGVAHTAVSASHVLFRSDGAPVLVGFGSAEVFEPDLPEVRRELIPAVIADRAALADLVDAVLSRVTGSRSAAAASFASALRSVPHLDLEARLSRELFELAAARPVAFGAFDPPSDRPGRAVAVDASAVPASAVVPPGEHATLIALRAALVPLLESGPAALARQWLIRRWSTWSQGRRRVVVGGGTAVLAVAIAAATVPGAASERDDGSPELTPPSTLPTNPPVGIPSVVTGDDPLEALPALMSRRTECFSDLSVLCLDDVAEPGSAAWDRDRAAVDALVSSGTQPHLISAIGAVLVERLGDSALISLAPPSDPASVLLMKGEAGWRVRDYIVSAPSLTG